VFASRNALARSTGLLHLLQRAGRLHESDLLPHTCPSPFRGDRRTASHGHVAAPTSRRNGNTRLIQPQAFSPAPALAGIQLDPAPAAHHTARRAAPGRGCKYSHDLGPWSLLVDHGRITTWPGASRRQHQPVIIAVGHHQAADEPGRKPHEVGLGEHPFALLIQEHDLRRLGEFWPRRATFRLQAFLSCIMASMPVRGYRPGNRSPSVFSPLMTGIAMYSSAKRAVQSSIFMVSSHRILTG